MFVIFHHGREILTSALDFILASCDVEGNFLVVKVYICAHFIYGPLISHYTGLQLYRSTVLHASRCVSHTYPLISGPHLTEM